MDRYRSDHIVHLMKIKAFDFGTGDTATDRAMVWRRDTSAPLPETLTAAFRR